MCPPRAGRRTEAHPAACRVMPETPAPFPPRRCAGPPRRWRLRGPAGGVRRHAAQARGAARAAESERGRASRGGEHHPGGRCAASRSEVRSTRAAVAALGALAAAAGAGEAGDESGAAGVYRGGGWDGAGVRAHRAGTEKSGGVCRAMAGGECATRWFTLIPGPMQTQFRL